MKKIYLTIIFVIVALTAYGQRGSGIKGVVTDVRTGKVIVGATVIIDGTNKGTATKSDGSFIIYPDKNHINKTTVTASFLGYESQTINLNDDAHKNGLSFSLKLSATDIDQVEVFGERYKQPDKLNFITRMPLRPSEQIQSISVVSDKLIAQQGALTLGDAARNVVGVSTFGTFGGTSESLTVRGFRGMPVLKNGVRIHTDFRGGGTLNEMQGVESVQVIKGSASITQGIGNDLASAGGVLNIATKTPKFINTGEVTMRSGSWGMFRPAFDIQNVISRNGDVAVRLNGVYQRSDNFRKYVSNDRVYLNPSIAWRPDSKTEIILEMDYLHDSRTPDKGTVNLSAFDENNLYDLPHNKFLGFATDRVFTNQSNYTVRLSRQISDKLVLRVAVVGSSLDTDNTSTGTKEYSYTQPVTDPETGDPVIDQETGLQKTEKITDYYRLTRTVGRSLRNDKNQLVQIDLVGRDVMSGPIKHTFQVGMDYRTNKLKTTSYTSSAVDVIDINSTWSNYLPDDFTQPTAGTPAKTTGYSYGIMAQDVVTFNKYFKTVLGLRYSYQQSKTAANSITDTGDAFNPMVGLIVTPWKNIHLFGSYTTTTDLRSADNLMEDGSKLGKSVIRQFETGIKSEWINGRLRANLTLFHVINRNLAYGINNEAGVATGFYGKAGDLRRRGIEIEVTGRILPNLQAILGYALNDAEYRNSLSYMNGSAPINAPKHTANAWLYYTVSKGSLSGLSAGVGVYYVGERPVDDYSVKPTHGGGAEPGIKPFMMTAYTVVNATVGYEWNKFGVNLLFNNIFNELGYTSYARGGYINPIDPFNWGIRGSYSF